MTNTFARKMANAAANYCPAGAAQMPTMEMSKEERRATSIAAEKLNTARLRNEAFEAQKDERQIGLL